MWSQAVGFEVIYIPVCYIASLSILSIMHLPQCMAHRVYCQLALSLPSPFLSSSFCYSCFYWADSIRLITAAPTRRENNLISAAVAALLLLHLVCFVFKPQIWWKPMKGTPNVNTSFPKHGNYISPITITPSANQQKLLKAREKF